MNCKLCSSKNVDIITTKIRNASDDKMKVYKCNGCGVQFLHPYYSAIELQDYYSKYYRKEYTAPDYYNLKNIRSYFHQQKQEAKVRLKRVKKYLKKTDDILEIGCSSGYFLDTVKSYVNRVYGTEWDEKSAKFAQDMGFTVLKNPEDFDILFDKIFIFHVLEHISDPVKFLINLKNKLKKDGILFMEVPNNNDILLTGYKIEEFKNFYYQSAHAWYFNRPSLSYILSKAGYKHEIINIQRYDLSNHIYWLKNKKPGGQGFYNDIFDQKIKKAYERFLIENDYSDTLFVIATK